MNRNYGGVIWTNHAMERMKKRGISPSNALVTFTQPDKSRFAKSKGGWIFIKTIGGWKYEVVAKRNEEKEWIILTVWTKPVYRISRYRSVKKRSWLMRLLRQIFLGDYR